MEAIENGRRNVVEAGSGIDNELEEQVKQQATLFRTAYRRTVEEAWKLGQALRRAKEQVRHGQWIPWVEGEIGLTPRTAQRLMALHEAYPEMRHVSHLNSVSHALRVLPSAPKSMDPQEQPSSTELAESGSVPVADQAAAEDVAKSAKDIARVVKRLESIVEASVGAPPACRELQFQTLCGALQAVVSAMVRSVEQAPTDTGSSATTQNLVLSLQAALAKAQGFYPSSVRPGDPRQ